MIVAYATIADQATLLLGLSAENVRRLRHGEPAVVEPIEGLPRVVIFGGRGTEADLRAQLAEHFDLPDEEPHR